ncbi:hypothetical protein FB451DRAFT_1478535 [Mycena latifolia]|nr:hypothetical protein FB451DRAFT_1478535 [Mycena latifolia]
MSMCVGSTKPAELCPELHATPLLNQRTVGTHGSCLVAVETSSAVSALAALLGLNLSGLNVPIALGCSPITIIGNNCGGTEVVCDAPEKEWGSLIAINCIPITL